MRLRSIGCSLLLAACKAAEPTGEDPLGMKSDGKVDLGPFDSNQLKISWFRFELPVNAAMEGDNLKVKGAVGWESHWRAIFSHSWLRNRGYKAEQYLRYVPGMRTAYNDFGFADVEVRRMVGRLVKAGMIQVSDTDPSGLTKEWFDRILKTPANAATYKGEVVYARILVVESEASRKTMLLSAYRNDPRQFAIVRKLDEMASQLMSLFAPEVGGVRTDPTR